MVCCTALLVFPTVVSLYDRLVWHKSGLGPLKSSQVMAKNTVAPDADGAASIPLLEEETSMMAHIGAVTTVTFFTGGPAPVSVLRERVAAVVAANPWLAGRLERGRGEKRMRLTFDATAKTMREGIFNVARPGQYKVQGVSYDALQKVLKGSPAEVKGGVKTVNKDELQTKVTIIPDEGNEWALVVSISHTIVDGYTYYQIYNMLSASAEIKSLSPVRKESFSVADVPTLQHEDGQLRRFTRSSCSTKSQ